MRQIQDACLNDGNLEKEVVIKDEDLFHEERQVLGVETSHPSQIVILSKEA